MTPIETVADALFKTPATSADALIVKFAAAVTVVGVPEIVPVAVSNKRPAGSVPEIE